VFRQDTGVDVCTQLQIPVMKTSSAIINETKCRYLAKMHKGVKLALRRAHVPSPVRSFPLNEHRKQETTIQKRKSLPSITVSVGSVLGTEGKLLGCIVSAFCSCRE
jgi:hypothetical protein